MDTDGTLILTGFAAAIVILVWLARQWINSTSHQIERWLEQLQAGKRPRIPEHATHWDYEVNLDLEGFTVVPLSDASEARISLRWISIITATAFKRDLYSTDRVSIAFRSTDGYEVEVHEEMKGWAELCDALPNHLPGTPAWTDWFMDISTPAFELNPTILFCRDNANRDVPAPHPAVE